jgi:hypothetical protein
MVLSSRIRRSSTVATFYPARLHGPQYDRLANLGIIRHDLEEVLRLCDEIDGVLNDPKKSLIVRALWATAIVTYWRCYKSKQVGCTRLTYSEVTPRLSISTEGSA